MTERQHIPGLDLAKLEEIVGSGDADAAIAAFHGAGQALAGAQRLLGLAASRAPDASSAVLCDALTQGLVAEFKVENRNLNQRLQQGDRDFPAFLSRIQSADTRYGDVLAEMDAAIDAAWGQRVAAIIGAEVLSKVRVDLDAVSASMNDRVDAGIARVLELKRELTVTKTFVSTVQARVSGEKWAARICLGVLCITLVIGVLVLLHPPWTEMGWQNQLFARLAILTPGVVIVHLLYGKYRLHQMAAIKYRHLSGFLGGGATQLAELLGGDEETKRKAYERMAALFLDTDDLMHAAGQKLHTPADDMKDLARELAALTAEVAKLKKPPP